MNRFLAPSLFFLLTLVTLTGCATVTYSFPSERPSGATFKTVRVFYRESPLFGFSPWESPTRPAAEDLVLMKKELGTRDWAQVGALVEAANQGKGEKTRNETLAAAVDVFRAAVLADHEVLFQGEVTYDGQTHPIEVMARVLDQAREQVDPKTNQKVKETPFTRSTISEVTATSGSQKLFEISRTLPEYAPMFPFVVLQTADKNFEVAMTTLETLEAKEASPNASQHGLMFNLKRRGQVFEVRSGQQLVANFDADFLTYRTDTPDLAAVKNLAAAVLAFREIVSRFYLADEVLILSPNGTSVAISPTKTTPAALWSDRR